MKLELSEKEIPYLRKRVANYDKVFTKGWFLVAFIACGLLLAAFAIIVHIKSIECEALSNRLMEETKLPWGNDEEIKRYIDYRNADTLARSRFFFHRKTIFPMLGLLGVFAVIFWHKSRHEPIDIKIYRALLKEFDEKSGEKQS